jgi:hypothetical protein
VGEKMDIFCGSDRRSAVYVAHKSGHNNAIRQTDLWKNAGAERSYEKMTIISEHTGDQTIYATRQRRRTSVRTTVQTGVYLGVLGRAV